ncbi:hypothetical protein JW960_20560 [candidate division KSB1 bacterium]|nr:hypothetical protein [candidate division KSB1 bacterium]
MENGFHSCFPSSCFGTTNVRDYFNNKPVLIFLWIAHFYISHQSNVMIYANDVPLRAMAIRIIMRISGFGITALGAGTVDILLPAAARCKRWLKKFQRLT